MKMTINEKEFLRKVKNTYPYLNGFLSQKSLELFKVEMGIKEINPNKVDVKDYIDWKQKKIREKNVNKELKKRGKFFEYYNHRSSIKETNKITEEPLWFYLGKYDNKYLYWQHSQKINLFTRKFILEDFFSLNLAQEDERKQRKRILRFVKKYGFSFIKYPFLFNYKDGGKDYFRYFIQEYFLFEKTSELITEDKKFPYFLKEPKLNNKNYWKWYNKYGRIIFQLNEHDVFLKRTRPPIMSVLLKRPKTKVQFTGDIYPYSINLLYDYIFQNVNSIKKCGYCNKIFIPKNKRQDCCSPIHSKRIRDQKYKDKKKIKKI